MRKPKMLAIFDIDGTIIDTQAAEGDCYANAMLSVTGISLNTLDWAAYKEPTSSGIFRELLDGNPRLKELEMVFKNRFVELLHNVRPQFPSDFVPIKGVVEFIEKLKEESRCDVAFATGGFDTEARFKLSCCGIDLSEFPHATSSDTPCRRDILPLAAERAGHPLSSVVYFGDAPWDVKVTEELEIPMIGIGRRIDQLRALGLSSVYRDYADIEGLFEILSLLNDS